jgi:hypothetical protein
VTSGLPRWVARNIAPQYKQLVKVNALMASFFGFDSGQYMPIESIGATTFVVPKSLPSQWAKA